MGRSRDQIYHSVNGTLRTPIGRRLLNCEIIIQIMIDIYGNFVTTHKFM